MENIGRGAVAPGAGPDGGWGNQGAIRRYTFTNLPGPDLMPLRYLTDARPFYEQLVQANLPFRVTLSFELVLTNPVNDVDHYFHGKIPSDV